MTLNTFISTVNLKAKSSSPKPTTPSLQRGKLDFFYDQY